ncbi:DUF2842 domain-containing protein [Alisedimentitalea sp. MJ-SS2]|uniref:DUF2842 domain-containing protein n=1 Tax=Aliisedimentitalea sp. MJ-SS2 TaxID=3049795 RepID=UPI002913972C|nr:DUF2842 domain-containing protein [Alisedimentitalea sp. MJ-SS2]MDU8926431.1 DUF2842 domain-containing protein [Alisedimentitalea sp. MJ-SS2]
MFEKLSYKARRRWALIVLVVGMPLYIVACVSVLGALNRPPFWLELLVYVGLGLAWILPFKGLFKGIGQSDPDAPVDDE